MVWLSVTRYPIGGSGENMNYPNVVGKPWDRKEHGLIVPRCYSIRCGVPKCEQAFISNRAFGVIRPMARHYREKHPQRPFVLRKSFWAKQINIPQGLLK